jgi:hypothetical protein
MCSNFTAVFVVDVMVFFTIHSSTLDDIVLRRAQCESESAALSDLRKNVFAQNLLRLARPGTQCDRSLKRPVTAPCSHHPPTLQELFRVSCWHANIKAGPARRSRDTAKVAVFRLAPPHPGRFCIPPRSVDACFWQGLSYLTARPFKGGRSATRRVVSVGMLVHPRKRTKHGRRVPLAQRPE